MEQLPESVQPLAEAHMPAHLKQRLEDEQQRYSHGSSVDAELRDASARHDALLQDKVQHLHEQNEHCGLMMVVHWMQAKRVHEMHEHKLKETEERVETKKSTVAAQQAELSDLEARLRKADEVERLLRAKLGEQV
ncbi:hypothetical protein Rhopal_004177-T1 [Rhodotorula paludigena]|uniref:Uncharacterized protein n=1 Tax=Rhodotorula paludigena TaxID=86838 RepID=A0AAV5GPH9_9BASI|nr:hypothetical protein Rhopal_004177-T1 [Rhodotorula paludigena]